MYKSDVKEKYQQKLKKAQENKGKMELSVKNQ